MNSIHDEAFAQAKKLLTTAPTLAYFDMTKETCLYTDASTLGIGFVLLQKSIGSDPEWKTVQAGSRFLSDVESRYAVIELECLAVAWGIKKCNLFLAGIDHFIVVTDHSPLIKHPSIGRNRKPSLTTPEDSHNGIQFHCSVAQRHQKQSSRCAFPAPQA